MNVYSAESKRGSKSRYTFDVFYDGLGYQVKAKCYRLRRDNTEECVYHNEWQSPDKAGLKALDYDGLRLARAFLNSEFFGDA